MCTCRASGIFAAQAQASFSWDAGGFFDPLQLASDNSARTSKLREAEIKHGRLAMVAFLGALACMLPWRLVYAGVCFHPSASAC